VFDIKHQLKVLIFLILLLSHLIQELFQASEGARITETVRDKTVAFAPPPSIPDPHIALASRTCNCISSKNPRMFLAANEERPHTISRPASLESTGRVVSFWGAEVIDVPFESWGHNYRKTPAEQEALVRCRV
jgi:hypothetical protein